MLETAYNCPHFEFTIHSMCEKLKEKGIEASLERVSREVKKCDKFKVKSSTSGKVLSFLIIRANYVMMIYIQRNREVIMDVNIGLTIPNL